MDKKLKEICNLPEHKILFVGIGNVLKSDDGVGVYISRKIRKTSNIITLTAEVSIENYIGKINSLKPDILIIIDCVDMKSDPGSYKLLKIDKVFDLTFNTHNISLKKLSGFFHMPTFVLGIQPQNLSFGEIISFPVLETARKIIKLINNKEVNHGITISLSDLRRSVKS